MTLTANELTTKYRERDREAHILKILQYMKEYNIAVSDLEEYTGEVDFSKRVLDIRKKIRAKETKRNVQRGW